MPKIIVSIISAAFALVIGFACGALLTKPDNLIMQKLIDQKIEVSIELNALKEKNNELNINISEIEKENDRLKNDLINAQRKKESSGF
jgi:FtsZ-binding cell division protein ZapB